MANIQKGSLLFNGLRRVIGRKAKSTFTYEVDKTSSQRWLDGRIAKLKDQQKFFSAEDGIPIWWKTTGDKVMTTFVFASTIGCFVVTLNNLIKYSQGKL